MTKRTLRESSCIIWRDIFGDRKAIRQICLSLAPPKFSAIRYMWLHGPGIPTISTRELKSIIKLGYHSYNCDLLTQTNGDGDLLIQMIRSAISDTQFQEQCYSGKKLPLNGILVRITNLKSWYFNSPQVIYLHITGSRAS